MTLINKHLQALAKVIETASFETAAKQLHISQSAVSQRIKQLEQQLGQVLLLRSTPPMPTAMGQRLMVFFRQAELLEQDVFDHREHSQRLAVGINADSLAAWFLAAVEPFIKRENILLDVRVDDQDETLQLLRSGDVVGVVSAEQQSISGCEAHLLGRMSYCCVCTPEFRQTYFADGINRQAFERAPAVHYSDKDQLQSRFLAQHWQLGPKQYPFHQIPSVESYLDFIRRGLAWGIVPKHQCAQLLSNGELVQLTPNTTIEVPLYWHTWSVKSDLLRRFSHAIQTYCRDQLK